jgi:isoaspartyl peptidase/L-asparaginase-like protein (Ntn-hydrolase superfamily)
VIGAGTWADDRLAVSCTGSGERFIRAALAHELSARVRYTDDSVPDAAAVVIRGLTGEGGLIVVGNDGSFAMPFNTTLMYRGRAAAGSVQTSIWQD